MSKVNPFTGLKIRSSVIFPNLPTSKNVFMTSFKEYSQRLNSSRKTQSIYNTPKFLLNTTNTKISKFIFKGTNKNQVKSRKESEEKKQILCPKKFSIDKCSISIKTLDKAKVILKRIHVRAEKVQSFLCKFNKLSSKDINFERTKLNIDDFVFLKTIGIGLFGKVKLAKWKTKDKSCAIKIISKECIIKMKQVQHVINEKEILLSIDHPFIVTWYLL